MILESLKKVNNSRLEYLQKKYSESNHPKDLEFLKEINLEISRRKRRKYVNQKSGKKV